MRVHYLQYRRSTVECFVVFVYAAGQIRTSLANELISGVLLRRRLVAHPVHLPCSAIISGVVYNCDIAVSVPRKVRKSNGHFRLGS